MKVYIDLDNLENITNNALIKISRKNAKPEIVELVDLCSLSEYTKKLCERLVKMLTDRAELVQTGSVAEFMFTVYDLQESVKEILGETK